MNQLFNFKVGYIFFLSQNNKIRLVIFFSRIFHINYFFYKLESYKKYIQKLKSSVLNLLTHINVHHSIT